MNDGFSRCMVVYIALAGVLVGVPATANADPTPQGVAFEIISSSRSAQVEGQVTLTGRDGVEPQATVSDQQGSGAPGELSLSLVRPLPLLEDGSSFVDAHANATQDSLIGPAVLGFSAAATGSAVWSLEPSTSFAARLSGETAYSVAFRTPVERTFVLRGFAITSTVARFEATLRDAELGTIVCKRSITDALEFARMT